MRERSHAEGGLSAGEPIELLTAQAPIGIVRTRGDGTVLDANPAFCAMLGYTCDELRGRSFFAFTHPDDRDLDVDKLAQVYAGEVASYALQKRLRRKDGAYLWTRTTTSAVRDGAGAPLFACAFVEDIDALHRADDERRRADRRFQLLARLSPVGMFHLDAAGCCHYVNEEWSKITGRTLPEALGNGWLRVVHPADAERLLPGWQAAIARGRPIHAEHRVLRPDGTVVHVLCQIAEAHDAGSRVFVGTLTDITDRVQAEFDRARLAAIVESSVDGVLLVDPGGLVQTWNAGAEQISGHTADDMIGRPLCSLAVGREAELRCALLRVGGGEVVRELELVLRRQDGREFDAAITACPVRAADGTTSAISVIVRDVTRRKQIERELRHSEERFRLIVEATAKIVWSLDDDARMLGDSPSWRAFTGQTRDEMHGHGWLGRLAPADRARAHEAWAAARATRGVFCCEGRVLRADGTWADTIARAVPLPDQDGAPREWVGVSIDVTEERELLRRVSESEAKFRRVYESGLIGLVFTDRRGQIRDANPEFLRIVGYDPADLAAGALRWDQVAPRADDGPPAGWFAPSERPHEGELVRKDGRRVAVMVGCAALGDAEGDQTVAFVLDVSERRAAEVQREALVADLRRAMHYYDMFIGVLSHDLRSPLAAILMSAGLALRRCEDEQLAKILRRIADSGQRMLRMIEQLLDATRVRAAGALTIERTPADLAVICRAIVDELEHAHPDAEIVLESAGSTGGEWDIDRVSQLASNLIGNAIQHAAESRRITIRVDGTDPATVRLRVHNMGSIPPALQASIFDPFRRAAETSSKSAGLGLGLYITRQIALAHGGDVTVTSTPEGGTTFFVELPRLPAPDAHPPAEADAATPLMRGDAAP